MFVTSDADRAGLLVAVVSGGRPSLEQRPTARFLDDLDPAGIAGAVWVVSERDAPGYERDGRDICVYSQEWAQAYAEQHWMQPTPPDPNSFLGAFPGREWACREAERRGCWGVLQLDDNILNLSVIRGGSAAMEYSRTHGGLALFADLLAAVTLSTNGRMVGAGLQSTAKERFRIARAGFPYSCFIERVGDGREEWYGPFEDDITHGFQYGTRADGGTAVVVPGLRYMKESTSQSGMRSKYNHERSVQLQRIFPESAKISVHKSKSNGLGGPRVFHTMAGGAIRNPLVVTDQKLWGAAKARIEHILVEWHRLNLESNRVKVAKRAAKVAS